MRSKRIHSSLSAAKPARSSPDLGDTLRHEMKWLSAAVHTRIQSYFSNDKEQPDSTVLPAPPKLSGSTPYEKLVLATCKNIDDRLVLALALTPHLAPQVLDFFFLKNDKTDRGFSEFGGVKGINHAGFIPTGETALFLLCGDDAGARLKRLRMFEPTHPLLASGAVRLAAPHGDEPAWSGALSFSSSFLRHLITGEEQKPELGAAFPARPILTPLTWDDLVLDPQALAEIGEIKAWAQYREKLLGDWGLARQLKPGYRALFHGPSGTGKTLTASLLGKALNVEVYRVDLSQVVSKYIGETEKNLSSVFTEAERRSWILFFDEADALFGKRTQTSSAHDRYANQEVAYLLQRIEDHPGIVILASNLKSNLDEAFARRFQVMVYFAPPNVAQRLRLWKNTFGSKVKLGSDVDLPAIARQYDLTGGQILNVVRTSALLGVQRTDQTIQGADIHRAIRREFVNTGRTG